MTASRTPHPRGSDSDGIAVASWLRGARGGWVAWVERPRVAGGLLVGLVVIVGVYLFHLTSGSSFWFDEWLWITGRRGDSVHTFLSAYNGHLSLVPIVLFRILLAVCGLRHYGPYRGVAIVGHLLVAVLVFAYVRARLGGLPGLLAAALILLLGPGWQDILWGFQIAWTLAVAAGVGAFLLLERRSGRADVLACGLLVVSIASTSLGVAVVLGVAVDLALSRRAWRDAWVVTVPLGLYIVWSIAYQPGGVTASGIVHAVPYAVQAAAATLASLVGLSGLSVDDVTGLTQPVGIPLLIILVGIVVWLGRRGRLTARAGSLATVVVVFWLLIAFNRASEGPGTSRYVYVTCVFVLLLIAELAYGTAAGSRRDGRSPLTRRAPLNALGATILTLLVLAAAVTNLGVMRDAASFLRVEGATTDADLAALDLDHAHLRPGAMATALPGYPLIRLSARQYVTAERALGTPAFSVAELTSTIPTAQTAADTQLVDSGEISVSAGAGGATGAQHGCVRLAPPAVEPPGASDPATFTVPASGVRVRSTGSPVSLAARRFGPTFVPLATLAPDAGAVVSVVSDASRQPWTVELTSSDPVSVCRAPSGGG